MAAGSVGTVTAHEFLARLAQLHPHEHKGQRAPHKPLLLLFALGRVLRARDRLVSYVEVDRQVGQLMRSFGSPRSAVRPHYPFRWLLSDALWDIPRYSDLRKNRSGDFYVGQLSELGIEGGFPQDVYDLLRDDPGLAWRAVGEILREHFPQSLHPEIRDAAGVPDDWSKWDVEIEEAPPAPMVREAEDAAPTTYSFLARRRRRDPLFRKKVLEEYGERCSVCDLDIRLGDRLLGVEAAHIRWHSHGGPDAVTNGLALCLLHHKSLDSGALGLEEHKGTGFRVLISRDVRGETIESLSDFSGHSIRPPRTPTVAPDGDFVRWHRREVFRGEAPG